MTGLIHGSWRRYSYKQFMFMGFAIKDYSGLKGLRKIHYMRPTQICNTRTIKTPTIDWKPLRSSKTDITQAEGREKSRGFRKVVLGLMIAMPVVSFCLGCWQVSRLKWKVNLIARSEDALAQPPLEKIPSKLDPSVIPEFEYRKFKVKGHFDYSQEMFLGPRLKDDMVGYLVVCPFVRCEGGKPILVERGWIRKDKVIPASREKGLLSYLAMPKGDIEIEALFRVMPQKSFMQYDHEMGSRLFYIPDVEAMAKQSNSLPIYCQMIYDLSDHAEWKRNSLQNNSDKHSLFGGLFKEKRSSNESKTKVDHDRPVLQFSEFDFVEQGVPIAPQPDIKLRNNHLQYLITWFSLSFASAGLLIYTIVKNRKLMSAEKIIEAKRSDMKKHW